MTDSTYRQRGVNQASAGGGNAVYALGLIGALVYFWQQADSFGQYLLAILKALVWPAFLRCMRCSRASSADYPFEAWVRHVPLASTIARRPETMEF